MKPDHFQWLQTLGKPEDLKILALKSPNQLLFRAKKSITPETTGKLSFKNSKEMIQSKKITFNMCNEPALLYSLISISDKDVTGGLFDKLSHETLYLETKDCRYELCKEDEKSNKFKLSSLRNPLQADNEFFTKSEVPLPPSELSKVMTTTFSEIQWGNTSTKFKDTLVNGIISYKFYRNQNQNEEATKKQKLI